MPTFVQTCVYLCSDKIRAWWLFCKVKKGKQIGFIVLGVAMMLAVLYTCNKSSDSGGKEETSTSDSTAIAPSQTDTPQSPSKLGEDTTTNVETTTESNVEVAPIQKGKKKQSYYVSPLDGPLLLSGSFGELRNNHFHAGLDLRTGGVEGKAVRAAASGYVSRIKVSGSGYGKALYIQHPNGTTTVYGHLKQFSGEIQDAVIAKQYALKKYEFDWYVPAGKLKVNQGQQVALSGNTGGSGGPHLHFEIRDKRGYTVNPLLYGLDVEDNIPPFVKSAKLYHLDFQRYEAYGIFANAPVTKNQTMQVPPGAYGVGVSWVDYFTDKLNRLGINYAEVQVDGKTIFTQTIEDFAFSQGRYINKHIDYWTFSERGIRYVKMFKDQGNPLHFYKGNGRITVKEDELVSVKIIAHDYHGGMSTLEFQLEGKSAAPALANGGNATPGPIKCSPNKNNTLTSENATVSIAKGSLYNTTYMGLTESPKTGKAVSPMIRVNHAHVPLHKSATIQIKIPSEYVSLKDKLVMMSYNRSSKSSSYEGGRVSGNYIVETSKSLGMYYLALDTVPPVIKPLSTGSFLSFRISDLTSDIDTYNCYVDGEWVLLEYEPKANKIFGNLPKSYKKGNHSLELRVTDGAGNTAIYKKNITI